MAQLFPKSSKKADNAMSYAERERREHVAEVHQQIENGLFSATPTRAAGTESILGGIGLAQRDATKYETSTKTEAAPKLHPAVVALQCTRTIAAKSAEALSLIVTAHERAKGEAIQFANEELGHALQVSTKDAGGIVDDLVRGQLISARLNTLGGHAGYAPTLPRA